MELTNVAAQTVAAGADILFGETAVHGNNSMYHREGSGQVSLRGLACS